MKAKTPIKKLMLNKKTISSLNNREMEDANGGIFYSLQPTCLCTETCSCVVSICDTCM